jgi:hypothetical protein
VNTCLGGDERGFFFEARFTGARFTFRGDVFFAMTPRMMNHRIRLQSTDCRFPIALEIERVPIAVVLSAD